MKKAKAPEKKKSSFVFLSVKSAFFIVFMILLSTLGFPLIFDALGLQLLPLRTILIGVTTAFAFCYAVFCIDSDIGFTRRFWILFVLITVLVSVISYFWVYDIYYL